MCLQINIRCFIPLATYLRTFSVPEKPYLACLNALRKPLPSWAKDTEAAGGRQYLPRCHTSAWTPGHSVQPVLHPLAPNLPKCGSVVAAVKRTAGERARTSKFPMAILVLVKNPGILQWCKIQWKQEMSIWLTSGKGFIPSKCLSTEGFLLQLHGLLIDGHNKQKTIFSCPAIIKIAMLGLCLGIAVSTVVFFKLYPC